MIITAPSGEIVNAHFYFSAFQFYRTALIPFCCTTVLF